VEKGRWALTLWWVLARYSRYLLMSLLVYRNASVIILIIDAYLNNCWIQGNDKHGMEIEDDKCL